MLKTCTSIIKSQTFSVHSTNTTVIEAEDMCTEMRVYMTAMPFNLKLKSPLQQHSLIGSNLRSGQETGLMHQNKPNPWTLHRNSICSQHLCQTPQDNPRCGVRAHMDDSCFGSTRENNTRLGRWF